MRIILFGAGRTAYDIWQEMAGKTYMYKDDYLAFTDNNTNLWGTSFCGKPVIAPSEISTLESDLIVIASIYKDSIWKQLTEKLGIPEEKIECFEEYHKKCYAEWVYTRRYGKETVNRKQSNIRMRKTVVYTAITGNYDELQEPLFQSDDLTYVCITNNPAVKSNGWNMVYIRNDGRDNVHLARHIKMNPHIYFQDYEVSVWVDGKYRIMDDLRTYIEKYAGESSILCFPHPERQCICDEVAACIILNKANKGDMILQISDYIRKGYPLDQGLYETGCIIRDHNDEQVRFLMKKWEEEVIKYTVRDQLSFPYVCWANGFLPDICDLDINRNQWLQNKGHL